MSVEGHLRARLRQVEEDYRKAMAARDNLAGQVVVLRAKLEHECAVTKQLAELVAATVKKETT